MTPWRRCLSPLNGLLAAVLLAGCPDRRQPEPPPRVPKPRLEQERSDPIKMGPERPAPLRQV